MDMSTIRRWLTPQDRTLRLLSTDTMNSRSDRADFTCEWFQPHLLEFCRSSEDMFLITGGPGSGKSTLASWTMERLEKSLGRKSYDVNSVMIGTQCSPLSGTKLIIENRFYYEERIDFLECNQAPLASIVGTNRRQRLVL